MVIFLVGDVVSMWLHVHVTCGTCGAEVSTELAGLLCHSVLLLSGVSKVNSPYQGDDHNS